LRCEVCGCKINSPLRALIEGARLTVCIECSKHGKIIREDDVEPGPKAPRKSQLSVSAKIPKKKTLEAKVEITQEVVEGYHMKFDRLGKSLGFHMKSWAKE
jgi:ribosome-binding protein aMBF1 (putative translation factor)